MGFKSTVTKNGMSGMLYFTIICSNTEKFNGTTRFLLRGFESREVMYDAIENQNYPDEPEKQIKYAFEEEYQMPIADLDKGEWPQIYEWLKDNHFPDAVDVFE